jgi:hypothetical protein
LITGDFDASTESTIWQFHHVNIEHSKEKRKENEDGHSENDLPVQKFFQYNRLLSIE